MLENAAEALDLIKTYSACRINSCTTTHQTGRLFDVVRTRRERAPDLRVSNPECVYSYETGMS